MVDPVVSTPSITQNQHLEIYPGGPIYSEESHKLGSNGIGDVVNGRELQKEIEAELEVTQDSAQVAADLILRMRDEALYSDLGCDTFDEYINRFLKDRLERIRNTLDPKVIRTARRKVEVGLYQAGKNTTEVAKVVGVSAEQVRTDLRREGVERRGRGPELPSSLDTKVSNEPKSPKVVVSKEVHDMVVDKMARAEAAKTEDPVTEHLEQVQICSRVITACLRVSESVRGLQKRLGVPPDDQREALLGHAQNAIRTLQWVEEICSSSIEDEFRNHFGGTDE